MPDSIDELLSCLTLLLSCFHVCSLGIMPGSLLLSGYHAWISSSLIIMPKSQALWLTCMNLLMTCYHVWLLLSCYHVWLFLSLYHAQQSCWLVIMYDSLNFWLFIIPDSSALWLSCLTFLLTCYHAWFFWWLFIMADSSALLLSCLIVLMSGSLLLSDNHARLSWWLVIMYDPLDVWLFIMPDSSALWWLCLTLRIACYHVQCSLCHILMSAIHICYFSILPDTICCLVSCMSFIDVWYTVMYVTHRRQ